MAVILSCKSIAKSYYARPLIEGLSFGVETGDKIGVIGPNGAGKSTFLRILAGLEQADEGEVARRRNLRASYLAQTESYPANAACFALVKEAAMVGGMTDDEADTKAAIIMSQIGFIDVHATTGSLSGGWRKRLQIACAAVQDPDLLLLDEPTNHLDLQGVLWLEEFLKTAPFAWVMVTHDRQMLERVATKVAEINRVYPGGIFVSEGHYSDFLEKRADFFAQQAKLEETLANQARREVEWLRRSPSARRTKAQYRIDEANALIQELSDLRTRMRTGQTEIDFSATGRKTKRLIVADNVHKSLGERQIIHDLNLVITPGMSLGILGANGTGKTTVLKLLRGEHAPDRGHVTLADGLRVVYFDQTRQRLDLAQKLKFFLSETGDSVIYRGQGMHIMSWVNRFQFRREQLELSLGELSGGEQARALIAKLMLEDADVLLLDEPTNDLDIGTLEALEDSLSDFPGAVVLVSHDRYLMNKVCNIVLGLDGKGGATLYADYEQWEAALQRQKDSERSAAKAKVSREPTDTTPARASTTSKRLSYMEQREYELMEAKILTAEQDLAAKQAIAEDPALAHSSLKLQAAYEELKSAQELVETLYARWAELEGKLK